MAVPYTFGSATTSIPLSQLDSNFATAITLGNTAVQLGNTITTLTGVTNVASGTSLTLGSNGNTTAVTIDTSQNVGIGTASPKMKLNAEGTYGNPVTSGATPTGIARFSQTTNNVTLDFGVTTGNRVWMQGADKGDLSFTYDVVINPNGGNVGIGTSSPSSALSVARSSGEAVISVSNSGTASSWLTLNPGSSGVGYIHNTGNTSTVFTTNGTERMRINSSGNLLVGTTSVIALGKISTSFDGSVAFGATFQTTYGPAGATFAAFINSSGTQQGSIYGNTTSTVQYLTSSDYRLKENIVPMTGALAKVAQLKPCTFKWKSDGSASQGFIAHELQEVVPECVGGEKDAVDADGNPKYQGIDTSFLVATLTAAIQEQQALIQSLTTRIASQDADIAALKAKVGI